MIQFCERCGYLSYHSENKKLCPCCGEKLVEADLEEMVFVHMTDEEIKEYTNKHLNPNISTPEYVEKYRLWEKARCERIRQSTIEFNREHPECPYCHGRNTWKISTGSRLLSVGLFGLGSKKIGKQWHCDNCDSHF